MRTVKIFFLFWEIIFKTFSTHFVSYSYDKYCDLCMDKHVGMVYRLSARKSTKSWVLEYCIRNRALFESTNRKNDIVSGVSVVWKSSKLRNNAMWDPGPSIIENICEYSRYIPMSQRWDRQPNAKIHEFTAVSFLGSISLRFLKKILWFWTRDAL